MVVKVKITDKEALQQLPIENILEYCRCNGWTVESRKDNDKWWRVWPPNSTIGFSISLEQNHRYATWVNVIISWRSSAEKNELDVYNEIKNLVR